MKSFGWFHMFIIIAISGSVILSTTYGFAQARHPALASYRVIVPESDSTTSCGTGTAIHPNLVLTNSHVVGHRLAERVSIERRNSNERYLGRVEGIDPGRDLAIVYVPDADLPWVSLAESDPQPGSDCEVYGYGTNHQLDFGRGRTIPCDGIGRGAGGAQWRLVATNFGYRQGDSGSALFVNNKLAAVNWGTLSDRTEGRATPVSEVHRFLAWWRANHSRGTEFTGHCFGNACPPAGMQRSPSSGRWQIMTDPPNDSMAPSCEAEDLVAIDRRVVDLESRLASLERTPGPTGPRGPPGESADPTRLAALERRVDELANGSFLLRIYDAETQRLIDQERVQVFGGTMNLKIYRIHGD